MSVLEISLNPQDFPREISPVSGMDFLIPPLFGWSSEYGYSVDISWWWSKCSNSNSAMNFTETFNVNALH